MTAGRWMTIETACERAASIEGVPQMGFIKLARLLKSGDVVGKVTRKDLTHYYVDVVDEHYILEFNIDEKFWAHVEPKIRPNMIEFKQWGDDKDIPADEEYLLGNGELFEISEWQFCVLTESFNKAFAGELAKPSATFVESRKPAIGGRPAVYDWARAGAIMAAYVFVNGYPLQQSALVDVLLQWFEAERREPHRREIEKFVTQMYLTRDQLLQSENVVSPS